MCECGDEELRGGCFNPWCGVEKTNQLTIAVPVKPRCGKRFKIPITEIYDNDACIVVDGEEYYVDIHDLLQVAISLYSRLLIEKGDHLSSMALRLARKEYER